MGSEITAKSNLTENVEVELESLVPEAYGNFDEMLAYFNGGSGTQYKHDGLAVGDVVAEMQHVLRVIASSRKNATGSDPLYVRLETPQSVAESPVGSQRYHPELMSIDKDDVYGAIHALEVALSYMPFVTTEVPRWKEIRNTDVVRMEKALDRLKQARDERC